MNNHKVGFPQRWIIKRRFKQQGIAAALFIEGASSADNVDMHGETQSASLARYITEEKILKCFIVGSRRLATPEVARIDSPRCDAIGFIKVELAQISCFKLYRERALALLRFQRCGHNPREISVE